MATTVTIGAELAVAGGAAAEVCRHWSALGGVSERHRWRGHETICDPDGIWRYADTDDAVASRSDRPCGYCGKANTQEGHDACLGTLPDVENACCGHGHEADAYVVFNSGQRIAGRDALDRIADALEQELD